MIPRKVSVNGAGDPCRLLKEHWAVLSLLALMLAGAALAVESVLGATQLLLPCDFSAFFVISVPPSDIFVHHHFANAVKYVLSVCFCHCWTRTGVYSLKALEFPRHV